MQNTRSSTSTERGSLRIAIAYWRDGGRYPRAVVRDEDDPYLRAAAVMVASLHRHCPDVAIELHTNVAEDDPAGHDLTAMGVTFVPTPFEHRMPPGYFHKFSASTYAIDVLTALPHRMSGDEVALLIDPDVVWLRDPKPLVAQARMHGLVGYVIPYPPDFEDLGFTPRRLAALTADLTCRPVGRGGLIPYLGGELLGGTHAHLERFATTCSHVWQRSLHRFHTDDPPWLHTEEHVYTAAFHALGLGADHTTTAIRRVWTRPGRLRNVRADDLDRIAWHVLAEKGRGLDRLHADHAKAAGAFEPAISDEEFRRRAARRLSIHPSYADRLSFRGSRLNARLRGRRLGPMPA